MVLPLQPIPRIDDAASRALDALTWGEKGRALFSPVTDRARRDANEIRDVTRRSSHVEDCRGGESNP
jgi:hypothetical protein